MAKITDLPYELLLGIVEQAAVGRPLGAILRMVFVCKRFAGVVEPLLYRNIVQDKVDSDRPASILAKSLLSNLDRTSYIQSLRWEGRFNAAFKLGKSEIQPPIALDQTQRRRVEQMVDDTFSGKDKDNVEKRDRWRKECLASSPLHLLALLLPRMSRLSELVIVAMSPEWWCVLEEGADGYIRQVNRNPTSQPSPFQALRTISVLENNLRNPHSIVQLDTILKWPNTKHIVMDTVAEFSDWDDDVPKRQFLVLEPRSLSLKTLKFDYGILSGRHLIRLLRSARALETFECVYDCSLFRTTLKISDLSQALLQQAHSLRTIRVQRLQLSMPWEDGEPALLNFSVFQSLRKLVICSTVLFTQDNGVVLRPRMAREYILGALPTSLEELSILKCVSMDEAEAVSAALRALIHDEENNFQLLKRIEWECDRDGLGESMNVLWRDRQALHELAKQKGIGLVTWVKAGFFEYQANNHVEFEAQWRMSTVP